MKRAAIVQGDRQVFVRSIILLIIAFAMDGCGIANADVQSFAAPYYMVEHGQMREFYMTAAHADLRSNSGRGVAQNYYLTDKQLSSHSSTLLRSLADCPPYRKLSSNDDFNLITVAEAIAPPFTLDSAPKHVNWVIGNDPVVVAIGTKIIPENEIVLFGGINPNPITGEKIPPDTIRLVSSADFSERATDIYILPRWLSRGPVIGKGGDPEKMLAEMLKSNIKYIHLPQPIAIQEIMNTQPWKQLVESSSHPTSN